MDNAFGAQSNTIYLVAASMDNAFGAQSNTIYLVAASMDNAFGAQVANCIKHHISSGS